MNIEYKYIVLQNGCVDRLFVFPKVFVHSEFFRAIRGFPENKGFRLVSGGFTDLKILLWWKRESWGTVTHRG